MISIYTLDCPIENVVKYVGKTVSPKSRIKQHIEESRKSESTEKKRWIRNLLKAGKIPIMKIVSTHEDQELARKAEEELCIKNIETILNVHNPGKGKRDFASSKNLKGVGK